MSGSESKKTKKKQKKSEDVSEPSEQENAPATTEEESSEPFLEGNEMTRMTFGDGGFPLYVKAAWGIFLVSFAVYLYTFALPDLTAWGAP
jgi:hypothetical protein